MNAMFHILQDVYIEIVVHMIATTLFSMDEQ